MRDGWNTYYLLLLASFLSLSFPAGLILISRSLSGSNKGGNRGRQFDKITPVSDDARPWHKTEKKTNARFFLALNSGIILIVMGLVLIPAVAIFRELAIGNAKDLLLRAMIIVFLSCGVMITGLLYASRKGDLNWIRSTRREK